MNVETVIGRTPNVFVVSLFCVLIIYVEFCFANNCHDGLLYIDMRLHCQFIVQKLAVLSSRFVVPSNLLYLLLFS